MLSARKLRASGGDASAAFLPAGPRVTVMSSGSFGILMTRPIATGFIAAALIVVVLPVILPPVRRMLGAVPPDDTT